jgi:Putative transmembrane protein (PGPGW)
MTTHPHRRDVWGDDPEERDADAVVAEIAAADGTRERRWHDHPTIVPFKAFLLFFGRNVKRIVITILGVLVVLIGIVLIPLPGPGWAIVFGGIAILATEYVWAQRLLVYAKRKALSAKDKILRRRP